MNGDDNIKARLRRYSKSDNKDKSEPTSPLCTSDQEHFSSGSSTKVRQTLVKYKYQPSLPTTPDESSYSQGATSTMQQQELDQYPRPEDIMPQQWWKLYIKMNEVLTSVKCQLISLQGNSTKKGEEDEIESSRLDVCEEIASKLETKMNMMADIMINQEKEINSLKNELLLIKKSKNRNRIRISGLDQGLLETKSQLQKKVTDFFTEQMETQDKIKIVDAHRMGPKDNRERPVRVKLANVEDKTTIFKNAPKLKGKTNGRKRLFFVDNELDPISAEKCRGAIITIVLCPLVVDVVY